MKNRLTIAISGVLAASAMSVHATNFDFGAWAERQLQDKSEQLFGVERPLGASASLSIDAATGDATPLKFVTAAKGLKVSVVSNAATLGKAIDMMVLWPNDKNPTHIIACNEETGPTGAGGVQRIRLSDGKVENIIKSPLVSCDPAEITPWGTVVVGEENGANGRAFEILDPLNTTDVEVSGTGGATTTTDPAHVRYLGALGQLSYEGISIMPNGVVYYQDENRPSATDNGGGYFKFIPTTLWAGGAPISSLDQSPLASGRVFGLRLGRNGANGTTNFGTDIGAGNKAGRGNWVEVVGVTPGFNLRAAATTLKLTTGYRPEDQDIDKAAAAAGLVRVCGNNTGQDTTDANPNGNNNFGETFCITDGTIAQSAVINTVSQTIGGVNYTLNAGPGTSIPEYQTLILGNRDFGMPDNIAYQPGSGNWIVHEDGDGATYTPPRNNDIWACLDDGNDDDHLSDGCVKVITINDLTAETTGGVFDADGSDFYFSVQHNITGHGLVVKVSGWKNGLKRNK